MCAVLWTQKKQAWNAMPLAIDKLFMVMPFGQRVTAKI